MLPSPAPPRSRAGQPATESVHAIATVCSPRGPGAVTGRRDAHPVLQPTTLLRSLGNRGAVANVRAVLDERRREDWLVAALLRRLDESRSGLAAATVHPARTDRAA